MNWIIASVLSGDRQLQYKHTIVKGAGPLNHELILENSLFIKTS